MNRYKIIPLNHYADSAKTFEAIRKLARPVFLDSNHPNCQSERFDILSAAPIATLTTRNGVTEISQKGQLVSTSDKNPFTLLQEALAKFAPPNQKNNIDLPFTGGAIGFFSYDLIRNIETLPSIAKNDLNIPEMDIGIYLWAVVVDHLLGQTKLIAHPACCAEQLKEVQNLLAGPIPDKPGNPFQIQAPFRSNMSAHEYRDKHQRILDYIHAGDCYQVNLAQRFCAPCQGEPWTAYREIRNHTDAPLSAFLQFEHYTILCLSPERFIRVHQREVQTSPIKGTAARHPNAEQDRLEAQALAKSAKDHAENLMIVDLLRNDLGKNCVPGSIKVPKLFNIESYFNVHHLVSTIKGCLADDRQTLDLLEGCFPGGSITGAPKLRAMEIIEELEPHRRTAYCGSVAYIGFDGNMDSNITIRTLVHQDNQIYCWGGGGIVADSKADKEYQESYIKIQRLLQILTQLSSSKNSTEDSSQ